MPFQGPAGYEPAGLIRLPDREADWNGAGQCFRSLQHRHWTIQFPHGWTDACGGPFRRSLDSEGLLAVPHGFVQSCSARWARQAMATAATTRCCGVWRARTQKPSTPTVARCALTRSGEPVTAAQWHAPSRIRSRG